MNFIAVSSEDRDRLLHGSWSMPGTALILHPDPSTHDPFGLLTLSQFTFYMWEADMFMHGWATCAAVQSQHSGKWVVQHIADYADVRDMLRRSYDMPEDWAQQIALYVTRRRAMNDRFRPLL